jgi:Rrf2 family iron-sulfur cluster assembly transcriptional regulator
MLSNSCRYGIRAVIYLAGKNPRDGNIGIKQISADLKLPTPFLAKILQQLAKNKLLSSTKGPNGGFMLLKKPESVTLLDIVRIIDGDGIFKNCIIHAGTCKGVKSRGKSCPVHDEYTKIRVELGDLFRSKTIAELVEKKDLPEKIISGMPDQSFSL